MERARNAAIPITRNLPTVIRSPRHPVRLAAALLAFVVAAGLAACADPTAGGLPPADADGIDATFLNHEIWNDGRSEVAFYRVRRDRNQYGEPEEQEFVVGTYLVKHDFDPTAQAKAGTGASQAVSAFKYALFYEFESGSYEYKRNHVVNARQRDLRPLKYSFTSFDWCSNIYKEQAFTPGEEVRYVMRSDDYGNAASEFAYREGTYPPALIPLLVRGMDFEDASRREFGVLLDSGDVVAAAAVRVGSDSVDTEAGRRAAERIRVTYAGDVPSPYAEESDREETYWRGLDDERLLLAVEGGTGRYRMELVEAVRSAYWDENVYDRLQRVSIRP